MRRLGQAIVVIFIRLVVRGQNGSDQSFSIGHDRRRELQFVIQFGVGNDLPRERPSRLLRYASIAVEWRTFV